MVAFFPFLHWIQSVLNLDYVESWGFGGLVFSFIVSAAFGIDPACLDD